MKELQRGPNRVRNITEKWRIMLSMYVIYFEHDAQNVTLTIRQNVFALAAGHSSTL